MAVETQSDLDAFFNPDEFGVNCILRSKVGDVPFNGIVSKYRADDLRLGASSNTSLSPFAVGASDVNATTIQCICRWDVVAIGRSDDQIEVLSGEHAGVYRLREPQQNGQIATLLLNKL